MRLKYFLLPAFSRRGIDVTGRRCCWLSCISCAFNLCRVRCHQCGVMHSIAFAHPRLERMAFMRVHPGQVFHVPHWKLKRDRAASLSSHMDRKASLGLGLDQLR